MCHDQRADRDSYMSDVSFLFAKQEYGLDFGLTITFVHGHRYPWTKAPE